MRALRFNLPTLSTYTILLLLLCCILPGLTGCERIQINGFTVKAPMTQDHLQNIIQAAADQGQVKRQGGVVEFVFADIPMACISDADNDRMRIIAPVVPAAKISEETRRILLEANFAATLDARYATSGDTLYAAFIHPLSPLSEMQIETAITQVASLVTTYGDTYTSGSLVFGAPEESEESGSDAAHPQTIDPPAEL